jgi:hypothetical protein
MVADAISYAHDHGSLRYFVARRLTSTARKEKPLAKPTAAVPEALETWSSGRKIGLCGQMR